MANSTYFLVTNKILRFAGQSEIASTSDFNSATLTKTQYQAKSFVDLANRLFTMDMPAEYMKRTGTITTTAVVADNNTGYTITGPIENVIRDSWFITTTGKGQPLSVKDYHQWLAEDPDGHTATGRPRYVVPRFQASSSGPAEKVSFDPVPDAVYTIQYSYYALPDVLSQADDVISLPPRVEPLLWLAASRFLEASLGEGRVADMSEYLIPFLTKARQMTFGSMELPPRIDISTTIRPRGATRRGSTRTAWSPEF